MWNFLLDHLLRHFVKNGSLHLTLANGQTRIYGDGTGTPIKVRFTSPDVPRRLLQNPELAVGEAYMDGTLVIEGDDLRGFLKLALKNREANGQVWWQRPAEWVRHAFRLIWQFNPASRARKNVAHHYDLSGELYDLFLDEDRQYSCAYFRDPDETLEQAQENKKHHIARKLLIEPGMSVLDIGCGWGGMAITLARDYGARVVGVTLSQEQYAIARRRVKDAGLADQVDIRLMDYRDVTESFDRIVSVGMFEHVGVPHYKEFFAQVRDRLTDDGIALIHTIGKAGRPYSPNAWVSKYIFPGGYAPAISEVTGVIDGMDFYINDIEGMRLHYAETLRRWHDRFEARIDKARELFDERFCRMWRFYLVSMERSFVEGRMLVYQFQLSKKNDVVPLTRDYIYRDDAQPVVELLHAAE